MTTRIQTPHAAVMIWNYIDRLNANGATPGTINKVQEEIISTLSLTGIQTFKSKGDPVGTFNFTLAPTRNWTAVLTPGSWCVIMMSNKIITKDSFKKADPELVKMFGKINSIRADVSVDANGTRETKYLVSGQDWSHIFNNTLYIDPLLSDALNAGDQGNALYIHIVKMLLGANGTPTTQSITENLRKLLSIFGKTINIPGSERVAKSTHTLKMPSQVVNFFDFSNSEITKVIDIKSGSLNKDNTYRQVRDGLGWINPYSLVGTHTLWQVMQDNANYALNELFTELNWTTSGPQLTLYNRIKPFSFQNIGVPGAAKELRSKFQNIQTNKLDDNLIFSLNAGTNWQEKINFIEVKPEMQEFKVFDNWVKQKSQAYNTNSSNVFDREGFRPLIFNIKQIPISFAGKTVDKFDANALQPWVRLMQEWYFDTHRLLNGQIIMTGSTDYIAVGNNIMFDAGLLNITPNYNSQTNSDQKFYILAHVESVRHNFSVNNDTRTFQTTIQFVRGIIVDSQKNLIGDGAIDTLSTSYSKEQSINGINTVSTSTVDIPSKENDG